MVKLDVLKFCLVPLILRLGLFLVCLILSLDALIKLFLKKECNVASCIFKRAILV